MSNDLKNTYPALGSFGLEYLVRLHRRQFSSFGDSCSRFFFPAEYIDKLKHLPGTARAVDSKSIYVLPPADTLQISLGDTLSQRRSVRPVCNERLTIAELSTLLKWAAGSISKDSWRRAYPSAGGLYPVELYCLCRDIETIPERNLAYYNPYDHALSVLESGKELNDILAINTADNAVNGHLSQVPLVIFLCAALSKVAIKYRDRGYAFSLLECGHIAQNIYLVGAAQGLQVCGIGGFANEEKCHDLFRELNPEMICVYAITVGKEK